MNDVALATPGSNRIGMLHRAFFLVPPVLLATLEVVRQAFDLSLDHHREWYLALLLVALVGMVLFATVVSRTVSSSYNQMRHQNQELLALHEASLSVASDLRLSSVLQNVVNEATAVIGARYGAISYGERLPDVDIFVTCGIDEAGRQAIGHPPLGRGVLGIPIASGATLRIEDIAGDPHAAGFPANHPPMQRLLAAPIAIQQRIVGNLYLADRRDNRPFSAGDEASLRRFGALAAIAIENALLHQQVEVLAITSERERIAREMHDSLSQVLAYVNTKSQAALGWLGQGNQQAAQEQIRELAEAAREAYVDVREGIFALRSAGQRNPESPVAEVIANYVDQWSLQQQVPVQFSADLPDQLGSIDPLAEVHLLRLVQEALSNVRKHAHASLVTISLRRVGDHWSLVISDDGRGFDPAAQVPGDFPRFGLATMRERAEASGGSFDLQSTPQVGTSITVTLPIRS
jgi:signal transduction histidine kinase